MLSRTLKITLPVLVLAAGFATLIILVKTKPKAQQAEPETEGLLVAVQTARAGRHEVAVEARGSVIAARKIELQPQVSGRVFWQNDDLVPGGRFDEGETILRIDPSDYELAVRSSRSQVSKAQLDLKLERSRKRIAEREWEIYGDEPAPGSSGAKARTDDDGTALAQHGPQLQAAKVALEAAKSALQRAKLDLRRTDVRAPFNAMVLEEHVDIGQVIGPQSPVATLVGTDRFWVRVSVPVAALQSIDVPGINADQGASARVIQSLGGKRVERPGRVVRLLGDLDEAGTMARILVEIDDPLGLKEGRSNEPHLPMLVGSYVEVAIDARPLEGVFELSRAALREGDKVFVMSDRSRLEVRNVRIAWRREDTVLISEGLHDGDRVITTRVGTPVEGMELRLAEDGAKPRPVAEAGGAEAPDGEEARP